MNARPLNYQDKIKISNRISQIRTNRGFAQSEFAEIMGVSKSTIDQWENNKSMPHMKKIRLMAFIFKLTPEWILYGEGGKVEQIINR